MGRYVAVVLAIGVAACGSKKQSEDQGSDPGAGTERSSLIGESTDASAPTPDSGALRFAAGPCGPSPQPGNGRAGGAGADVDGPGVEAGSGKGAPDGLRVPEEPKGTVKVSLKTVDGGLDEAVVRRYLRRYVSRLRFCYQRALSSGPSFGGTVKAKLVIDAEGKVINVGLSGNGRDGLFTCLKSAFASRAFPKPTDGGVLHVTAAVELIPGKDKAGSGRPMRKKRPPRKKPPAVPVASYDYEKVFGVFAAGSGSLQACIEPARATDPAVRGTFGIDFAVGDTGTASAVVVDSLLDDGAKTCIADATSKLAFPTHELKLTQHVRCYFEYGSVPAAESRKGAAVVDATGGGATAALIEPDSLVVIRATPDTTYEAVYKTVSDVRASGARYIAFDAQAGSAWEPAYTPPMPQARFHGDELAREPLHIHITTDAIRVRGAKKVRATDGKHDFDAVGDAMTTLTGKATYAHRTDVAIQADKDVAYATLIRVIRDAVRHGLTHVDLQAPNR
jgi:hypothetical protein